MACGDLRFEGYLPAPNEAQHIPGLASFCRLSSPVTLKGPDQRRNSLPLYVLYGSWNFGIMASQPAKEKVSF